MAIHLFFGIMANYPSVVQSCIMEESILIQHLTAYFGAHPRNIVCVYLFGSAARGQAGPDSDIDIAVLYESDPPTTLADFSCVSGDLERILGREVDIVVLNSAGVDLIHHVLRDGLMIYERDRSARIRFEVRARNEYFDMRPILDRYRRGKKEAING